MEEKKRKKGGKKEIRKKKSSTTEVLTSNNRTGISNLIPPPKKTQQTKNKEKKEKQNPIEIDKMAAAMLCFLPLCRDLSGNCDPHFSEQRHPIYTASVDNDEQRYSRAALLVSE